MVYLQCIHLVALHLLKTTKKKVPHSLDCNYSVTRIAFYQGEDKGVEFAGRYFAEKHCTLLF